MNENDHSLRSLAAPLANPTRRRFLQSMLAGGAAFVVGQPANAQETSYAEGVVFHDRNGSGVREEGDPGVPEVRVSNGRDVTVTDEEGRWRLPLDGDRTIFFVIKPSGWRAPLNGDNLPQFHYIHDPEGSPELEYEGIAPTGTLPDSIDFPLEPQEEPSELRVLMCGDPQPRNGREVAYIAQSAVPELAEAEADFGVSLGDIMFDNLEYYGPLNAAMGLAGKPWYNLLGNHDLNFDVPDNEHANDTFIRVYGPTYYAFEYGPVHFIVLNNIDWMGATEEGGSGSYRGRLGERQIEFVRNELEHVPQDKLSVIMMHIPLDSPDTEAEGSNTVDREDLYRIIEDRPNLLTLSAHRHLHGHFMLDEENGWRGDNPLHHIIMGTLCGSWFRGAPNEQGVPVAMMADGTPRGCGMFRFADQHYSMDGYKVFGAGADHQMHIEAPNVVARDEVEETGVYVNVYNGCERSEVRFRAGSDGAWRDMDRTVEPDPRYVWLYERDQDVESPYLSPSDPYNCYHLWRINLPADLPEGTHMLEVEATDRFGNVHRGARPMRVTA
ncbi:MAG: calcineurin-like phosphoesterase C-terminal domain-containing protein [Candidatus Hydrogenedentota bacterium]